MTGSAPIRILYGRRPSGGARRDRRSRGSAAGYDLGRRSRRYMIEATSQSSDPSGERLLRQRWILSCQARS